MKNTSKKHYVLVHGSCHGAWCWYKVKPLLEAHGHCVTLLDMGASGINHKTIHEIKTLIDYSEPLIQFMKYIPNDQKVILVGHSFGGFNLALAMEMFPQKIEVAVFVAAFLPDTLHVPSFIFDNFFAHMPEGLDFWLDTEFKKYEGDLKETRTQMLFGPKFLAERLYQLSPLEDYELGMALIRPSSLFLNDLCKQERKLSKDKYGSVRSVYVICNEDQAISEAFQLWMIENRGLKDVKELKGADHMPMFCMPKQLSDYLLEISQN